MKFITIILLTVCLFSCKTQKSHCDAHFSHSDTTYITPNHYHITSQYKCVWLDSTKQK